MERKVQSVILKEGNQIELSTEAMKVLNVQVGEELKILYTENALILMSSGQFGEEILKKL